MENTYEVHYPQILIGINSSGLTKLAENLKIIQAGFYPKIETKLQISQISDFW